GEKFSYRRPWRARAGSTLAQWQPDVLVCDIGLPGPGRLRADRRGARARHPTTAGHPGDRADRLRVDRGSAPRPGRGVRGAPRQADRPPDAGRGRAAPGLAPRGGLTLPTSRHTLLALP